MKIIKTSTLETRFNKLHTLTTYAADSMKAIVFHSERLLTYYFCVELEEKISRLRKCVEEWCSDLENFTTMCITVESQYYERQMDNGNCELVETIPTYSNDEIPATFQMAETMYKIGFYTMEEDVYGVGNKIFSVNEIQKDIEQLFAYAVFCVKALPNMTYQGIWADAGAKACEIHDHFCDQISANKQELCRIITTMQKDCMVTV